MGATLTNLPVHSSTQLAAQERLPLSTPGHLYSFHEPITQQFMFLPNLNAMLLLPWNAKWENAGNAKVNRRADTTLITAAQTYLYNCSSHLSRFLILVQPIEICLKLELLEWAGCDRAIRLLQIECLPMLGACHNQYLGKTPGFCKDPSPLPSSALYWCLLIPLTRRDREGQMKLKRDKGASLNWLSDTWLKVSH